MPSTWDGMNRSAGKRNPVALVKTVLARKIAVQASSRFPVRNPYTTTSPEPMPTRLMTTWTKVNNVIPKIMIVPPRPSRLMPE